MTGPLTQIVSLASFGNDFLYNDRLPEKYYPGNSCFQFCNKVDFRLFKRPFFSLKQKEFVVANDPQAWFAWLKKSGCKRLRLFLQPSKDQSLAKDYKLAGLVGGGGTWFIEALYADHSTAWTSRWEVTQKDDPQNNIWSVNYGMTVKQMPTINLQIEQQSCKNELNIALSEIEGFAFHQRLNDWGGQFKKAREALTASTPEAAYYHSELIPSDRFSLASRQLLYAAATAWVFGAMGSWNDLGFQSNEENKRYESLTETLYAKVNAAIISAVNSW